MPKITVQGIRIPARRTLLDEEVDPQAPNDMLKMFKQMRMRKIVIHSAEDCARECGEHREAE